MSKQSLQEPQRVASAGNEREYPTRHAAGGRSHNSANSRPWSLWMVGMWVAFFVLLANDQLGELWTWVRDLPILAEIVLWLAILPWMLGMAVWTSSWEQWVRMLLVVLFAVGWTVAALPGRPKAQTTA